jgi:hypothetical protein
VLVSNVVFGGAAAAVVGVLAAALLSFLWLAIPLLRRRRLES